MTNWFSALQMHHEHTVEGMNILLAWHKVSPGFQIFDRLPIRLYRPSEEWKAGAVSVFAWRRGKLISGNARTEALWPWAESRPEAGGQDSIG